jgi:cytochrome P450
MAHATAAPAEPLGTVDPTSRAYWSDVHGTLAALRERWPVVRSTAADFEVLRHADVERLLRDPGLRQALQSMLAKQGIARGPLVEWWRHLMNNYDPPEHTRLRGLVGRAFTPRQVARARVQIRAIAHALLDDLLARGEADLVATFCHELPLAVLCEMLGVAREDRERFGQWTSLVSSAFSAVIPKESIPAIEAALVRFDAEVEDLVRRRRARPEDDLLDALIHAEEAGDRLRPAELRALVINLLFAGHDTTKALLANALWTLAAHPDELARLRADPSLVPSAVEEIARYETPIPSIPRITTAPIEVGGVEIPEGSYVALSVPSANRDPRRFSAPDRFDVARADSRHFTFGFGAHHCVGAAVARAELQEALAVILERRVELEVQIDRPVWTAFLSARRPEALPARIRAAPGGARGRPR